jgi:hypothetical protein
MIGCAVVLCCIMYILYTDTVLLLTVYEIASLGI